MRTAFSTVLALSLIILSCRPIGKPGEACTVTGDGFTRKDSCGTTCINWAITCPDGSQVEPNVCAGDYCADGGVCPDGFHCLVVDSVPDNARCLPVDSCTPRARMSRDDSGADGLLND